MKDSLTNFFQTYKWGFPIASAIALIFAVPPIGFWGLVFVGLIPMFLFSFFSDSHIKTALAWGLFSAIHAAYLTYSTLSEFNWIEEAVLFTMMVKSAGVAIAIGVAIFFGGVMYAFSWMRRRVAVQYSFMVLVLGFASYALIEMFFFWLLHGFNYGALFFAAQNATYFFSLIHLGSPLFISVAVIAVNLLLWGTLLYATHLIPKKTYTILTTILLCVLAVPLCINAPDTAVAEKSISVAIIQEPERDESLTFGSTQDGMFSFPLLEAHLADASQSNPDFIVYPFAPWSGIISDEIDNTRFDREVITMDYEIFTQWLRVHVPSEIIFVAWYTTYRDGSYYNMIGYFRDGELLSEYAKEHLFPFFDYTPDWALDKGIVSLPFDGTPGVNNQPFVYNGVAINGLVCSEIADDHAVAQGSATGDVIFSLGSEMMFATQIPGEYNALRAQQGAKKYVVPVIRANKFGPSVVYDQNGKLLGKLDFQQTGILYVDISI
ncbi:MAG: apolipoprotein N-acyltransferase [Patiriisocius sp.]|jgi:apolipoprotein N-acyltransferase